MLTINTNWLAINFPSIFFDPLGGMAVAAASNGETEMLRLANKCDNDAVFVVVEVMATALFKDDAVHKLLGVFPTVLKPKDPRRLALCFCMGVVVVF